MPTFRIEFELFPVEDIVPWGEGPKAHLSWLALTHGTFRIIVGDDVLFRYTEEIRAHWAAAGEHVAHQDADYQIGLFACDLLEAAAAGCQPLPPQIERLARDWDALEQLSRQTSGDDDLEYVAWRWLGARQLWTPYFLECPQISFVRVRDDVQIHWDNRDRRIDDLPVWTAEKGVQTVPVDTFVRECRDFASRLLAMMALRLEDLASGHARPQVPVDVSSLRKQHQDWRIELDGYFGPHTPDVPWDETEEALRTLQARLRPGDMPG